MQQKDSLDRFIESAAAAGLGRHQGKGLSCPGDEALAMYIEGILDEAGTEIVEEHIAHCGDCLDLVAYARDAATPGTLYKAPAFVVDAGMEVVRRSNRTTLDIVVRFVKDALELVTSTGALSCMPAGSFARGGADTGKTLVCVTKGMDEILVEVDVERLETDVADITVSARDAKGGHPCTGMRASMFCGEREQTSMYMDNGRVTFERVPPRAYIIKLSRGGNAVGEVRLCMHGITENAE